MNFKTIQNFAFIAILFVVSAAFVWILLPYMMPIFWATVLAILFHPINEKIVKWLKGKRALASALTLSAVILALIIPASILGALFFNEAKNLYDIAIVQYANEDVTITRLTERIDAVLPFSIDTQELVSKFVHTVKSYGDNISSFAFGVGKTSVDFAVKFVVMLYILFFFLKDGPKWTERIMHVLPLGTKKERYLLRQFSKMVRAVFKGSFVIALIQGALGALLFAIVGIPSPIVWGALMMLFAFIPAVGPALVWVPAVIILFFTGKIQEALLVLLGGVFVIGTIDNLLRPFLLGKDTDLPDLLIFLSVLGALSVFGMVGIVIGPTIAALFLAVWELFEKEYEDELNKWG